MESEQRDLWRSLGSYDENEDDWLQEELELEFAMKESIALAKFQPSTVEGIPKSNSQKASYETLKFDLNPDEEDDDDEFVDLSYLQPEKEPIDSKWKVVNEETSPLSSPISSPISSVSTTTTQVTKVTTPVSDDEEEEEDEEVPQKTIEDTYDDDEVQEYRVDGEDDSDDEDTQFVKQHLADVARSQQIQKKQQQLKNDKIKRLDKLKAEERKKQRIQEEYLLFFPLCSPKQRRKRKRYRGEEKTKEEEEAY